MKILFPDTNLFLQCKDLSQINWGEISGGMDLCILISRPVQEEIDRHKHDGNSRRARRARKATSLFKEIILSEGTKKVIKDSAPLVEISFSPPPDTSQKLPEILDLANPDNRIIAEAISYKNLHPEMEVAVLTRDTNAMLTAKRCSFDFIIIPDDWLMEPEPDTRDRKISELEKRIRYLERNYPEIEVISYDKEGNYIESLSISIIQYRELNVQQIEELLVETCAFYPMEDNFNRTQKTMGYREQMIGISGLGLTHQYIPPTEEEIERYKKEEYPQWIETLKEFFGFIHQKLESPFRQINISVSINNIGNVPAENLLTELTLTEGLIFMPPSDNNGKSDEEQVITIPLPPEAPSGKLIQRENFGGILLGMQHSHSAFLDRDYSPPLIPRLNWNDKRDKHAFYWKHGRPNRSLNSWIFECEEFRHQVEAQIFNATICVPPNKITKGGALRCRITAKNLPKPAEYVLPIKVEYEHGDTFDRGQKLINPLGFNLKKDS